MVSSAGDQFAGHRRRHQHTHQQGESRHAGCRPPRLLDTDHNCHGGPVESEADGDPSHLDEDPVPGGDLEYKTMYYWAIDKVVGAVTTSGEVWSFKSEYDIEDVNMILWHKLDESSGDFVEDSSGYEHHGLLVGDEGWRPNDGHYGGSHAFNSILN